MGRNSVLLLDGQRAHAPAQADAALLPRRADAALRRRDARGRRAGDRDAGPWASRSACARARRRSRCRSSCARCSASTTPSGSRGWASGSPRCSTSACRAARSPRSPCRRCAARSGAASGSASCACARAADAEIYDEIARRRQATDVEDRDDVLSILLQARDEEGRALTDEELRDELMTLLVAGHETTATSLAWAFELLLRHRPQLARLQAEIESGNGDGEYLDAVIKETLRIRPVVPGVDPQADRADRAGRIRDPGRHARRAEHLPHAPPPRRVSRARALPPRALHRAPGGDLFVDPVRRRRAALPRRGVRDLRDEGRDPGDPASRAHARGRRRSRSASAGGRSRSFPSATERSSSRSSAASARDPRRPRPSRPDATALHVAFPAHGGPRGDRTGQADRHDHRRDRGARIRPRACAGRSPECRS